MPEVVITDNLSLKPSEYAISIDGDEIERGEVYADKAMAVGNHIDHPDLDGIVGIDPAYQLPALWIKKATKPRRSTMDFRSLKYMMLSRPTSAKYAVNT